MRWPVVVGLLAVAAGGAVLIAAGLNGAHGGEQPAPASGGPHADLGLGAEPDGLVDGGEGDDGGHDDGGAGADGQGGDDGDDGDDGEDGQSGSGGKGCGDGINVSVGDNCGDGD